MKHEKDDKKIVIYWNWKKIVNWILLIILVPVFAIFLISLTLKNTVANPNFYKENLTEANAYERLVNEAIPAIIMDSTLSEAQTTNFLAQQGIIFVIQKAISPNWVKEKADVLVDKIASFFSKPEQEPSVLIKMDDFSSNLKTINDGLILLNELVPTCEEAKSIDTEDNKLLNVSIDCDSMNINLDQIKTDISSIQSQINNISTKDIKIANQLKSVLDEINIFKNYFINLTVSFWTSLIISIVIIIILIFINLKTLFHTIHSITLSLGIGAAGILVYSLIERSLINSDLTKDLDLKITYSLKLIVTDIAKISIDNLFNYLIALSLITIAILIIINILTYILKHYKIIKD